MNYFPLSYYSPYISIHFDKYELYHINYIPNIFFDDAKKWFAIPSSLIGLFPTFGRPWGLPWRLGRLGNWSSAWIPSVKSDGKMRVLTREISGKMRISPMKNGWKRWISPISPVKNGWKMMQDEEKTPSNIKLILDTKLYCNRFRQQRCFVPGEWCKNLKGHIKGDFEWMFRIGW